MKKNKTIVIFLLIALIAGGLGFFAGSKYQTRKQLKVFQGFRQGRGMGNQNGFRGGAGEIISVDSKSMTVKMQDGSSRIVLFTDSTQINKASQGTKDDLKVRETVSVFGATNTDGSVTATIIQLNPELPKTP